MNKDYWITIKSIALNFNITIHTIEYFLGLIKKYWYDILRNNKNRYYSKEFKLQTINRVLINHESATFVKEIHILKSRDRGGIF